jgi:hypothetical protein
MDAITNFRAELAAILVPHKWSPTRQQLNAIAERLVKEKPHDIASVGAIVCSECPGTLVLSMEGTDNSDIRTLLSLALQAVAQARS